MEFSGSGKERDIRVQTAHNEKMVVISGNKRTNTSLDWTGGFIQYSCRSNRHLRSRKKYTNRKKPTGISSYHILVTRMWVQQMQNQPQILSESWFSTAWQCSQLQSEECRLVFVFHWLKIFRISVLLHVTFPAPILLEPCFPWRKLNVLIIFFICCNKITRQKQLIGEGTFFLYCCFRIQSIIARKSRKGEPEADDHIVAVDNKP